MAVVTHMIPLQLARSAARLAAAWLLLAAGSAAAQDEDDRRSWTVTVGGGVQTYAKFPGGDSYGINPWPIFGIRRDGAPMPFEAPDDGFDFEVLSRDSIINFGPDLRFQNKREEDDVGAAVGDVDFTVEAGGFVELFPSERFRLRAALRQGIGGHDGLVADLGADLILRDRDTYIFSIGPRLRWADDDYHDAYFGITPAVAAATGLPTFDPRGDFYALGVVAGYTRMISSDWGVKIYAGYDRLMGDAAESPIVRNFGSRDQFSGGVGLFYNFTIRR